MHGRRTRAPRLVALDHFRSLYGITDARDGMVRPIDKTPAVQCTIDLRRDRSGIGRRKRLFEWTTQPKRPRSVSTSTTQPSDTSQDQATAQPTPRPKTPRELLLASSPALLDLHCRPPYSSAINEAVEKQPPCRMLRKTYRGQTVAEKLCERILTLRPRLSISDLRVVLGDGYEPQELFLRCTQKPVKETKRKIRRLPLSKMPPLQLVLSSSQDSAAGHTRLLEVPLMDTADVGMVQELFMPVDSPPTVRTTPASSMYLADISSAGG